MLLSSETLDIKTNSEIGLHCLHFIFKGKFTETDSLKGTETWTEEFVTHPGQSYVIIWDCLKMSGFEAGARREWYQCIRLHENPIDEVKVISNQLLIRAAARVMLQFFGLRSRMVKTFEEIMEAAYIS